METATSVRVKMVPMDVLSGAVYPLVANRLDTVASKLSIFSARAFVQSVALARVDVATSTRPKIVVVSAASVVMPAGASRVLVATSVRA